MGRDRTTFRDKGTEVPSLSQDKGTTGQAQNLATGRDEPGCILWLQYINVRNLLKGGNYSRVETFQGQYFSVKI